jgi:hypothetical protein
VLKIKIESMANEIIDAYHTIEASEMSIWLLLLSN